MVAWIAIRVERRAILHRQEVLRAETAVQAALATAQSLLCETITQYPDSVSVWEERLPGLKTPGTALHIFQRFDANQPAHILVLPLISGIREARELGETPFDSPPELCDLNRLSPKNWMAPPGREAVSICAPWIPLSPDKEAPLLARFAFMLEDESFKLNIQEASCDGSPILLAAKDISLQAILSQLPDVGHEMREEWARRLVALREQLGGFGDLGQSNLVLRLTPDQWERWKFLCTVHSESLNFTRRGFPRTNIHKLFVPTLSQKEIRKQLDRFISAVQRESPYFGQRFYRPMTSLNHIHRISKRHEEIYLNKLAVNVRDFLLPGPNPTRVLNAENFPVLSSTDTRILRPTKGFGPNPIAAIGKKRIPYLQEYALAARLISMHPFSNFTAQSSEGAKFEMTLDHFLEFWNLSNEPIRVKDLGPGARLILRNQPSWDLNGRGLQGTGIPSSDERDIEIPLVSFKSLKGAPLVFQPGTATVLTTFPDELPVTLFPRGAQFFRTNEFPQWKRRFSGVTYRIQNGVKTGLYEVRTKLRNGGNADHETEYLLVNDHGWIDGFGYLPINQSIAMRENNGQKENDIFWYIRSSGLQGELNQAHQIGDPRTLNEQLLLGEQNATAGKNAAMADALNLLHNPVPHTRFLQNVGIENFPGKGSLGTVRSAYINFKKWADPVFSENTEQNTENFAPAVFPDTPLKTIADLGSVFDPIRGSLSQIERDRGGGKSLRIGQPEFHLSDQTPAVWDRDPLAPSREWTAWRLCDIFSVSDDRSLPGSVNINGVLRENGAVLKALLHDFRWSGNESRGLESEDIRLLVHHFQSRLLSKPPYQNRGGAFFERGEISEIDLFNSQDVFPKSLISKSWRGMKGRDDRVREEIIRYLLETITTRGSVFSAYCVGQALRMTASNKLLILVTRRAKFTFRLVPLDVNGKRMDKVFQPFTSNNEILSQPVRYGVELLTRED